MRQASAVRKAQGHGSGVYRRGNVFWLKVRTPASLANHLSRSFWRSSLRTNFRTEALCAARSVRAALDQGFVAVEVGMRLGMLTVAQGEAVITALVRRSLAEAESRRGLAGPRGEAAIEAARRDHLAGAAAWRDVLRRNDLSIVAPLVTAAAALAGLADPDHALVPDILREAARTLATVADENAEREDGFYAGDRARLLAKLDADQSIRTSTPESILVRQRVAEVAPREAACIAAAPEAAEAFPFASGRSARSGPMATSPAARAVEPAPLALSAAAQWVPPAQAAPTVTVPSQAVESEWAVSLAPQAGTVPEPIPAPVVVPAAEPAVGHPAAPTASAETSAVLELESGLPGGRHRAGRPAAEAATPGATTGRAPPGQERRDRTPAAAHPGAISRPDARGRLRADAGHFLQGRHRRELDAELGAGL